MHNLYWTHNVKLSHQKGISVHYVAAVGRYKFDSSFFDELTSRTHDIKLTMQAFIDVDQLPKLLLLTSNGNSLWEFSLNIQLCCEKQTQQQHS